MQGEVRVLDPTVCYQRHVTHDQVVWQENKNFRTPTKTQLSKGFLTHLYNPKIAMCALGAADQDACGVRL